MLFWAIFAFLWMALEGNLQRAVVFGVYSTLMALVYARRRLGGWGGRGGASTVLATATWGGLWGLASGLITLLLMAVKTGLHAHGPEFSAMEVAWVGQQIPLWSLAGFVGGIGVGLLRLALVRRER